MALLGSVLLLVFFISVLATLAIYALVLKRAELDDHHFALGLPRGSVRAILAIGLLIAFVGGSIAVFLTADEGRAVVLVESVAGQPINLPDGTFATKRTGTEDLWDVWRLPDQAMREKLAVQILTAIATALATVTGFYFGNRSAFSAAENIARQQSNPPPTDEGGEDPEAPAPQPGGPSGPGVLLPTD